MLSLAAPDLDVRAHLARRATALQAELAQMRGAARLADLAQLLREVAAIGAPDQGPAQAP